jgi:hypothetical protein
LGGIVKWVNTGAAAQPATDLMICDHGASAGGGTFRHQYVWIPDRGLIRCVKSALRLNDRVEQPMGELNENE